jgi:L-ascorbate metabolism protein UlaG (beta-lactamase superfamily)
MKITLTLLFAILLTYIGFSMLSSYNPPISDHSDGKRFHNLDPKIKPRGLLDLIKWRFTANHEKWPDVVPNEYSDTPPDRVYGDEIRVSFIGHASFLIQTQGLNVITDPLYSERCSPFESRGPKRVAPPGIPFEKLPEIDIVLVSHNHYDHLDTETLAKLVERFHPTIIAPLGNEHPINSKSQNANVKALDWYEAIEVAKGIKVHLEPAQHWSARGIFDRNKALWGTFVIDTPKGQILFIGDSGYSKEMFENIGEKFPNIRLSLIPIGAYEPRWFMSPIHMNPEEAVQTHIDLRSDYSIASHFATFQLTDEGYERPEIALNLAKEKLDVKKFDALKIGQFVALK